MPRLLQPIPAVFLAWALALATACLPARAQEPARASPDVAATLELRGDAERGRAAFKRCEMCHRRDASGRVDGSIPRLSGQHASVIVKQVLDIRHGLRINPAMKAVLDDSPPSLQAVADIAAYLQQLPITGVIGKGPATPSAKGRTLYEQDCASCHGGRGEGDPARFVPMVTQQHHRYLRDELDQILGGERGNSHPDMVKVLKGYAPADLQAVADHMAQLPPPRR